jgi:cytochrome d ubiquinol oxidase subunit II
MDLPTVWFLLFGVLVAGYAVLDGFDLGVGVLSLFARDETERRVHLAAIGPVWDGNEVWLLTAGGALFAAFPEAYATVFSGFYLVFVLLLLALIFRAVSFEFHGRVDTPRWRRFWSGAFGFGSLLPSLLYGVAVGHVLRGVPLGRDGEFAGTFVDLLHPYALLLGLLSLAMFLAHGAIYLALKAEGALAQRMRLSASRLWVAWVALFVAASAYGLVETPRLFPGAFRSIPFWIDFPALVAALVLVPVFLRSGALRRAFVASSAAIVATIGLVGLGLYPRLVPSSLDAAFDLTVYNASSSPRTLVVMLVIAGLGMPIVVGYTVFIYRAFKGQVAPSKDGW